MYESTNCVTCSTNPGRAALLGARYLVEMAIDCAIFVLVSDMLSGLWTHDMQISLEDKLVFQWSMRHGGRPSPSDVSLHYITVQPG
jgi:hypothetical protein